MNPLRSHHIQFYREFSKIANSGSDCYQFNGVKQLVMIFPGEIRWAVIYDPNKRSHSPLHINFSRESFRKDIYDAINPYISKVSSKPDREKWYYYNVTDWIGFREALRNFEQTAHLPPDSNECILSEEAIRMAATAQNIVNSSNGQEMTKTVKDKEMLFHSEKELSMHIEELLVKQQWQCAITGIPLEKDVSCSDPELRCSLDRIDSDGQYERGNLQIVCKFINR